jgi:hypothetical protein
MRGVERIDWKSTLFMSILLEEDYEEELLGPFNKELQT